MRFIKNCVFPKSLVIVHLSLTDRNKVRTNFKNIIYVYCKKNIRGRFFLSLVRNMHYAIIMYLRVKDIMLRARYTSIYAVKRAQVPITFHHLN